MGENQRIIDAFTEMAPRYEETVDRELHMFWGIRYETFINRLLANADLARSRRLLDVATGSAAIPRALIRRHGWPGQVVGVDITPEMLRQARLLLPEVQAGSPIKLVTGSGMRLPFAAESFDAVVCALATHHMNVPALLSELRRVVQPGALLLLADVATAPFWQTGVGKLWLRAMIGWYSLAQRGGARVRAETDALSNMLGPEAWQAALLRAGFVDLDLTTLPARKRWYPSGVMISARAS